MLLIVRYRKTYDSPETKIIVQNFEQLEKVLNEAINYKMRSVIKISDKDCQVKSKK